MKKLTENTINSLGSQGEAWINDLPTIVNDLGEYWTLRDIIPVKNMSWNYVATAIQGANSPVVLKISCDKELLIDEYRALNYFNGNGAIHVIDVNHQYNALLLQRAMPGELLKDAPQVTINESIKIYAKIIKHLTTKPVPSNYQAKHANDWLAIIDTINDARIEKHLANKAQELKQKMLGTPQKEYLCHGDLHLENIIKNGSQWIAIDPKGIIGEIAFEASAFDLMSKDERENKMSSTIIIRRVTQLAKELNISEERLFSWIFLRVMLSALWFIEDNGDPQYMLAMASLIYPLV